MNQRIDNGDVERERPGTPIPGAGHGGGLYRVRYRVGAPYVPTGHADLMRAVYTALESSGLEVSMTGGKVPRPKVAFGPPLPMRCLSGGEYLDLDLEHGTADILGALNAALPDGVEAFDAVRIDTKSAALSAIIGTAVYDFDVPDRVVPKQALEALLAGFATERARQVQRISPKGRVRTVDLKRAIIDVQARGCEDGTTVRVATKINDPEGHNANPALVLSGLFGLDEEGAAAVGVRRVGFLTEDGIPISGVIWRRRLTRSLHRKSFDHIRYVDS